MTLSIDLPADLEKHLQEIVQEDYDGDIQAAIRGLLELHDRYGWKDQLQKDVDAIRAEVRRSGGIRVEKVDQAVKRHRKKANRTHA